MEILWPILACTNVLMFVLVVAMQRLLRQSQRTAEQAMADAVELVVTLNKMTATLRQANENLIVAMDTLERYRRRFGSFPVMVIDESKKLN